MNKNSETLLVELLRRLVRMAATETDKIMLNAAISDKFQLFERSLSEKEPECNPIGKPEEKKEVELPGVGSEGVRPIALTRHDIHVLEDTLAKCTWGSELAMALCHVLSQVHRKTDVKSPPAESASQDPISPVSAGERKAREWWVSLTGLNIFNEKLNDAMILVREVLPDKPVQPAGTVEKSPPSPSGIL